MGMRNPAAGRGSRSCAAAWVCAAVLLLALPAVTAGKQAPEQPYALIHGTVWTPDLRPAYGIKIQIRRAGEKKVLWERMSDHLGEFAVRVPAQVADYIVVAEPGGKRPQVETKVHINSDERVDIGVHLTE